MILSIIRKPMVLKGWLCLVCTAAALAACAPVKAPAAAAASPSLTASLTSTPTHPQGRTWTPSLTGTATRTATGTPTYVPAIVYPAGSFNGWKRVEMNGYAIEIPPAYLIQKPANSPLPLLDIADSQATLEAWKRNDPVLPGLLVDFVAGPLNRKADPYSATSPLLSVEEALSRDIFQFCRNSDTVGSVPTQMILLGTAKAARVRSNGYIYYYILAPDESWYVRVVVETQETAWVEAAEQILSTIQFTQ